MRFIKGARGHESILGKDTSRKQNRDARPVSNNKIITNYYFYDAI